MTTNVAFKDTYNSFADIANLFLDIEEQLALIEGKENQERHAIAKEARKTMDEAYEIVCHGMLDMIIHPESSAEIQEEALTAARLLLCQIRIETGDR